MNTDINELIKEKYSTFSKKQKMIADAILQNYDKSAFLTADKLGQSISVSESTVVRFAVELGFEGYPEFQDALQKYVKTKLTPIQRIDVTSKQVAGGDLLSSVMQADIGRIKSTLAQIDRTVFEASAKAIAHAKRVYVFGVRSSSTLATFLHLNLAMIRDDVRYLQPTSSSEVFEQILDIEKDDVIVAISFPRYSTKILKAITYAKEMGATVISITDSNLSPIAESATYLLTAQSDIVSFADSLVAPLSLIDALIAETANQIPEEAKARFTQLEKIWNEYDVYTIK